MTSQHSRGWASIALALVLAACGNGTTPAAAPQPGFVPSGTPMAPMSGMPGLASGAGASAGPAVVGATKVAIQNFAFSPAAITVKVGTTVTWTNQDSDPHNVTTSNGPLHSPTMQNGATFSYTFTAAGTFGYLCTIHPFMTGTVTVTA